MVSLNPIKHFFIVLIGILMLVVISRFSIAEERTSTFSGRVIDENGESGQRIKLAIKPIELVLGDETGHREPISSWVNTTTDMNGNFTLKNIKPGPSRLVMLPENGADYEIVSIQMGDLTFYSTAFLRHFPVWFGKIVFAFEPGEHTKDVIVNVKKPRMRISGKILLEDGTPLVNADVKLRVFDRKGDNPFYFLSSSRSSGASGGNVTTDAEGYFVSYFPDREAQHQALIQYKGVSERTRWFKLKEGQRKDGLVFRLRGIKKHQGKREAREKARQATWAMNPVNGHAYKMIHCKDYADAKAKAKSENAYIVAINDEAEQRWLEAAFLQKDFYWIGLVSTETGMKWSNGQPLTYTNWVSQQPDYKHNHKRDYNIAMTFSSKKWTAIDVGNPIYQMVKYAIIEKENMRVTTQ